MHQYRPDSTSAAASRSKSMVCTDACVFVPQITCNPVMAPSLLVSQFGNASFEGFSTWIGDLMANETGLLKENSSGALQLSLSYGGRATFTCRKGYIASGNLTECTGYLHIDALADGTLRGADQYCKQIVCNALTINEADYVVPPIIELGSNGTVTCNAGYRAGPKGLEFMACADVKTYSVRCAGCKFESDMECLPVRCNTTGSITMSNATKSVSRNISKVLYAETVNVLCNTGYRIGTHNATGGMYAVGECAQDCRLNRDLSCLPVFCDTSALPTPKSAWAVGESGAGGMYYGEVAKIVCNAGYLADGGTCLSSFMVGCDSYGRVWNSDKVCNTSTRCTRPQDSNSIITSDMSTSGAQNYGSTATISCNFGYGVQSKPATFAPCNASLNYTGTCSQDCTFNASESCVPYRCAISDLSDELSGRGVMNHSIGGIYAYYGDTVTIRCNTGYTFGSAISKLRYTKANCSQSVCGSFGTSLCVELQCNRTMLNTGNATMAPSPSNPSATAIMLNYLESYVLTCNAGFMLASGGRTRSTYTTQFTSTCGDDGDMSGLDDYCVPIPCTLAVDSNAAGIQLRSSPAASSSELVHGNEVNVTCKNGYRAAILSLSSCDDDNWYVGTCAIFELNTSTPDMSCKPVVCAKLANIRSRLSEGEKGDWTSSTVLSTANHMNHGDNITISCNTGFSFGSSLSGQSMRTLTCTCDPNPWAPDDVNCVRSGCDVSILPPANAGPAMTNTEVSIDTALNITCNSGFYVESGPSNSSHYQTSFISTCGSDGTMTKLQERCKQITCKTVDKNQASQNPAPGMSYGTDVNVTCKNGYKAAARESTAAECSNHDSYQASCGVFDYSSSSECKQVFCDMTSVQSNLVGKGVASSNVTALKYGDSLQITCNTGFRYGGQADVKSKTVTCSCPWVAQNVNCMSVACDLSGLKLAVANITGVVTTPGWPPAEDTVNYGTQFTVLCSYGYSVDGASFAQGFTTMCEDDRRMTNIDRRCVPGNCTGIADANQASQSSSPRYYGESVFVTCKAGHRASSATSSTCDDEQTYNSNCTGFAYTPIIPSTACRQIKCGNLNSIRSSLAGKGTMTSTASEIAYGQSFTVSCNSGYRFANHSTFGPTSATVSCSCPWSPNTLNCSAVQCRSPLFPPGNASVTKGWTDGQLYPSFGEYTIKCNTGYLLSSGGSVRANYVTEFTMWCGNDGLLTNTAERCTRIPCHNTPPVDPQQKTQVPSGTTFNDDTLVITCNDGYRSSASSSSTCDQSQDYTAKCNVWNIVPAETNTSCKRVFCDLDSIRSTLTGNGNLSSTSASFGYGDTVDVTCDYGTRFGGSDANTNPRSATVTCACPWLPSNANCTPVKCSAAILPANPKATVKESNWLQVSSSTVTYGTSFTIQCNAGFYNARGPRHFSNYSTEVVSTCQDDGYMSNVSRPVREECLRISCEQADPHGNQTCTPSNCPDGPVFGNRVRVTCNAGYRSTSPAIPHFDCASGAGIKEYEVQCEAFTYIPVSQEQKCTPVICGGINAIRSSLNGKGVMQYQGETLTYGTAFNVSCNTGYRFDNPAPSSPRHAEVVCDCPFVASQTCVKVQCNASALPPAGAIVTSGLTGTSIYEWQTTLQVSCNSGYVQAQGSCRQHFDITCNEDGEWISPTGGAFCVPQEMCYEHVENCTVGFRAVSVESSATCSNGSSYLATCIDICTSSNDKACKPVECPIVFDGTLVPSRVFYNETITAACKLGYRFKSTEVSAPKNATVKCRHDCKLSESLECHPIVCNASVLSQTGLLNIQESWVDNLSAVNFSLGFHDQVRMYCRNTTIVESSPPGHCASSYLASCVDDGSIQGSVGGSLKCVPRFCDLRLLWDSIVAGNATVLYDNDLTVIPNSNRGVSEGAEVLVACNTGYRISSHSPSAPRNASTSCLPNCNFDPAHSCKLVECPAASVPPPNSYVSGRSWTNNAGSNKLYFGEILNITCNAGYMVESSPKGTCRRWFEVGCNDTGLLVGAYERCIRVNCGQYESDENRGAMNPLEGAYTGHQASVTCKEGYRVAPVSNESTTCAAPASYDVQCGACQYDKGPHHCAIAQCGPFNVTQWEEPLDRYLNFWNSTPFHGQGIHVPCAYAHRAALAHETYAQCFRNTSLSATCNDCSFTSPHRCRLVVCDTVDNVSTVSQGQMIHGTAGSMSCKAGYRASKAGEMPPSCENPMTFSANCSDCQYLTASTQCSRVMCNLSSIQNSQGFESLAPNVPYAVYEDQLIVSCLPGFRPMSDIAGWTATYNANLSYPEAYSSFHNASLSYITSWTSEHNASLSYVTAWTSVHNASMYYVTSWQTEYNSSKSYDIEFELGGMMVNMTVHCGAINCSCSEDGVSSTISPWSKDCGCACRAIIMAECSASNCSCSTTDTPNGVVAEAVTHSPIGKSCGCRCVEKSRAECSASNCSCSTTDTPHGVVAEAGTHSPIGKSCGCRCVEEERAACSASNCSCSTTDTPNGVVAMPITHSPFQSCGCSCQVASRARCSAANCSCAYNESMNHTLKDYHCECGCSLVEVRTLNATCAGDCEMSFTDHVDSPVCSPVACMAFSIPANASTNRTIKYVRFAQKGSTPPPEMTGSHSLVFGDTISVTCDAGYTRASLFAPGVCRNNYTVTCSERGLTQNKNESCRPIVCSKYAEDPNMASVEKGLDATNNVSMEAVTVDYGSSATVKCKRGFLATSSTAQCGMPSAYDVTCNDWEKCTYTQSQFCQPVECPIPEFQGTPHPARSFFNESLVIACKSAYRFMSKHVNGPKNRSLSCNPNCSLSEDPVCLPITCNASWLHYKGTSDFGIKNRTFARNLTLDANQHFEFHCNDSLIAKNGPPGACQTTYKVICVDDGSIESALGSFQCVPPFCDLRLFERASKYWHETVVYVVYAAKSSNSSNSSLFSDERIIRLKSNESQLPGGQTVIVACNTGYRMNTTDVDGPRNASTTCDPSNCNFASIPVCMPVRCNASALPPPDAHVSGNTWLENSTIIHFGELLNISCDPNYMVEGSSHGDLRTWFLVGCNDTGGLIGMQRCVRANCGEYNGDPHIMPVKNTNTLDEAVVTCDSGYRRTPTGASPVNCSVKERSYNLSCASNLGYYHINATDLKVCTPLRCGHFEVLEYNGGPRQFPAHDQLRLLPGLRSLPEYSVFGFAGGQLPGYQDGSAINARLRRPVRICLWNKQSQELLISAEHHIRTLSAQTGEFTTLVGSNQPGFQDARGTNARFQNPAGVAVGQVCETIGQAKPCDYIAVVADSGNHRIRRIHAVSKDVSTWAGSGTRGFSNGVGTYAKFNYPRDVIYQPNALGEFEAAFIADSGNHRIRKLNLTTNEVTTLSGSSESGFVDGPATAARFFDPQSLALSPDGITIYVADAGNHRIRAIHVSDGSVRTLAGSGLPGSADGIGTSSSFHNPRCVTVSVDGTRLLISDTTNNRIRSLDPISGRVFTLAGSGGRGFLSEGTDVAFAQPEGLLILNSLVYVADSENNLIRNLTFTPTSDARLTMALPYKHVPSVASSIHGQNVSLECGNNYRTAAKGHTYAFCSAGRTANATCDECLGSNLLASYSGDQCVEPACDPISNISTQTRQAIVNGEHGRIYCNPGYRAINGTLRAANENPDCSFPQSFLALCNDCNYDMRSWESKDEWLTCNLIKCDLAAVRQKDGVSSVLPAMQSVLYQAPIRIKCKPGYRPQDNNVSSPIEVETNCSDRCTTTFPDPVCKPVACPAWKIPSNSYVVGIDFGNGSFVKGSSFTEPTTLHFPQKVKVVCLQGFKLASNPSLSSCIQEYEVACDENATVRASQETCIPIQCPMIPNSNSYLPHNRPIAFHNRTQAACNIGYRPAPAGQSTMGCTAGRVFEMQCAQCELITDYTCVRCSDPPGKCPPYTPHPTRTVQEDLLPVRLKGIKGSYNLTASEELVLACPAGFGAVVPGLMLLEAPQEFSSGVYSVRCEYDGFLSGATGYCTCVSPAIELGFDETSGLPQCQCQAGYYGTVPSGESGRLKCEQCPTNSFSSRGASTLLGCGCNAGYYGADVRDCRTCPPNSFSTFGSRLLSECRCAVGTYKNGSGCVDCPDDSTSRFDSRNINDCRCNAGFQGYGEVGCSQCHQASQWRSTVCGVDTKYCTQCDCNAGYFGDGVTCTHCPGDATSIRGGNSKGTDCICPMGFYQLGEGCEPCPEHSSSAAGSTSLLQCLCTNGYYFDSIGMQCQSCPPMKTSPVGSNNVADCFCNYMYRSENGTCYRCPDRSHYDLQLGMCICEAGYIMQGPVDDENSVCTACEVGKYWVLNKKMSTVDPGQISTCVQCFDFATTKGEAGVGIDACWCMKGYSYPSWCDGATCGPCQLCPMGKYSDYIGRVPCTNCFAGSFTYVNGAESREDCTCNTGFEARVVDGLAECRMCAAGKFYTYNVSAATWACLSCKPNMYSQPGSTSCFCNAGYSGPDCAPCAAGKYKTTTGSGVCTGCPDHSSALNGSSVCLCNAGFESGSGICSACPAGKYKDATANAKCQHCLPQMSTSTVGTQLEKDCQCIPGWFEIKHATSSSKTEMYRFCSACQNGKYKETLSDDACSLCPAGAYSRIAATKRSHCQCNVGQTGPDGAESCQLCPLHQYKSSPGTAPCSQCPPVVGPGSQSRVTLQTGSTSVEQCLCPAGTTVDTLNPALCQSCVSGGTFKAEAGSEPCQPCTVSECEPGKYRGPCSVTTDAECSYHCTNAPVNSYYTSGGKPFNVNNCDFTRRCNEDAFFRFMIDPATNEFLGCGCAQGYFYFELAQDCRPCFPGSYSDAIGAYQCTSCDVGTYQPAAGQTACAECPDGAFSPPASNEREDCTCKAGYFGVVLANSGNCTVCAAGKYRGGETIPTVCLSCEAGKYSTSGSQVCRACTANSYSPAMAPTCICNAGYEPTASDPQTMRCVACPAGKYKTSAMLQCSACKDSSTSLGAASRCACESGYKKLSNAAEGECAACSPGYYSLSDSTYCLSCPINTYQGNSASSSCSACPPNSKTASTNTTDHCACKCNAGFRWSADVNASGNPQYCQHGATERDPCKPYCPMAGGNFYTLSPVSNDFKNYPIETQSVHLMCKAGFRLDDPDDPMGCKKTKQITCSGMGAWNKKPEQACKPVTCPFRSPDVNSMPVKLEVGYGEEVNVTCNAGYVLSRPSHQRMPYCDDTCTVQLNNLTCVAKTCNYIISYPSSIDLTGVHPNNLTATYPNQIGLACKEGFISTQNCMKDFRPACQASGTFSVQETPCMIAKCAPPYVFFSKSLETSENLQEFEFNQTATIDCEFGYVASPPGCSNSAISFTARCGSTGCKLQQSWTCGACAWQSQCTCQKVTCPPFQTPPNAVIADPDYSSETVFVAGDRLRVRCIPGYQIVNNTKCEKTFTVTCDLTGKMEFPGCEPIRCHHKRENFHADFWKKESVLAYLQSLDSIELTNGPTLVGSTLVVKCRESAGFRGTPLEATCMETCLLQPLPTCIIQKCDPYMPIMLDGMVSIPEFVSLERKHLGDSFTVTCQTGFFADDMSVLPGLESLGSVQVLAHMIFPVPDPNKMSVFSLEGYSSISISVPPGAWPTELTTGPSAAVFTPPPNFRRSTSQFVVGPYVSFGPSGVNFSAPIVISCAFNLTGIDEGNLEIRVHRYDTVSKKYYPLPYPVRLPGRRNPAVDKQRGSVEALVSIFDPPYVALATRMPIVAAPPPAKAVIIAINDSKRPDEEPEKKVDIWLYVAGGVSGIMFFACLAFVFMYRSLRKKMTEPLLEDSNSKAKGKTKDKDPEKQPEDPEKNGKDPEKKRKDLDADAVQTRKIEVNDSTVKADLIVLGKNGEAEEVELLAKPVTAQKVKDTDKTPAAKLREQSTVEVAI
jgi:hypothetical protein